MGYPGYPVYGQEIGSTIKDIKAIIAKIETNKFTKEDILKLHNANADLIKALLSDDYKD